MLLEPADTVVRQYGVTLLKVNAYSPEAIAYQWKFDGVEIAGETNAVLQLNDVRRNQAGKYSARLISQGRTIETREAELTVTWEVEMVSVREEEGYSPGTGQLKDAAGNFYTVEAVTREEEQVTKMGLQCRKYFPNGELAWSTEYLEKEQPGIYFKQLLVNSAGRVYVNTTAAAVWNAAKADVVTIAISADGVIEWVNRFECEEFYQQAALDSSGSLYLSAALAVSGAVETALLRTNTFALVKIGADGKLAWATPTRIDRTAFPTGIGADAQDRILCSGTRRRAGWSDVVELDRVVTKVDGEGRQLWENFEALYSDEIDTRLVLMYPDGGALMQGWFNWSSQFPGAYLDRIGPDGKRQFTISLAPWFLERAMVDDAQNLYLAVLERDWFFGFEEQRASVGKWDPQGHHLWQSKAAVYDGVMQVESLEVEGDTVRFSGAAHYGETPREFMVHAEFRENRTVDLPVIRAVSPAWARVHWGQPLTLSVLGSGPNLSYQWRFNGNAIAGETNNVLSFSKVTTKSAGSYSILLRNEIGAALSEEIWVALISVPTFSLKLPVRELIVTSDASGTATNSYMRVEVAGETDKVYALEASTNLVRWYLESTNKLVYPEGSREGPMKFYRAWLVE